ncbi:MAG: hypothetical protein JO249_09445 [Acidobacteria bacterium]|nr:hypothetical protein [Acidobacteriota bacterium]
MSEHASILVEGAHRVARRQRILWWVFAVNLLLAFASALPLSHRIGDVTDHSLRAKRLAEGFDWGTYSELLTTPDVDLGSALPESAGAVLLFLGFMLFLNGGILTSYASEYTLSTREFFANCGAFFWRSVRLLFFMLVIVVPVAYAAHALLHWGTSLMENAADEKTGYLVDLGFLMLAALVLMTVRLWFDMAQVRMVLEDEHPIRRSCARAFRLTCANFGSLFWFYLRISLLAWFGLGMGLWLWIRLSGPAAVIMLQFILLWWVATRLWQRASEVTWYQRSLMRPLPAAASAGAWSPVQQPAPLPATPDPLLPDE